jgi:hypothetical protein
MRRVVTGSDPQGKPTIVSDGEPPRTVHLRHTPGLIDRVVWGTDSPFPCNPGGDDPTPSMSTLLPGPGETRFTVVTFPPDAIFDSADFDPAAAAAEYAQVSPGLADRFDPEDPGMHQTPTVDYAIVLDGRLALDLGPDGGLTELEPGDVVVQNGVRHAWRNPFDRPGTAAFILIGCDPEAGSAGSTAR